MNVKWESLSQAEWEEFHLAQRGSLQQAWAYGEAMMALGVTMKRAMVWRDGDLVGIAQFMCKRMLGYISLASCSRGPLFSPDVTPTERSTTLELMRRSITLPRLKFLLFSFDRTIDQIDTIETRGMSRVMTGYATVMLDLTKPLSILKEHMEGKWRNRLNKALSHSQLRVQVQPSLKRCDWLLGQELAQREAKKFHALPTNFVKAYIAAFSDPKRAFVVAYAELGKNTVGGMLFLIHGRVASYHMGWADDEGRQISAHNALLWHSMAHLQELGVELLDLGGVNTHDLPGISRFKLGTGGRAVTLAGTYF